MSQYGNLVPYLLAAAAAGAVAAATVETCPGRVPRLAQPVQQRT